MMLMYILQAVVGVEVVLPRNSIRNCHSPKPPNKGINQPENHITGQYFVVNELYCSGTVFRSMKVICGELMLLC